tara:strand:+ start:1512 stop:1880 length:369 start_codon:yes stop_codon:yes gene_type:complete
MSSIITGKSRKNIADLEAISSELYENIFKVNIIENKDKNFLFYNTLNKVIFPDNLSGDTYDELTVQVDTPWTTLSFNLYGTINLWWVVYLINKPKYIFLAKSGSTVKYITPSAISLILNSMK